MRIRYKIAGELKYYKHRNGDWILQLNGRARNVGTGVGEVLSLDASSTEWWHTFQRLQNSLREAFTANFKHRP